MKNTEDLEYEHVDETIISMFFVAEQEGFSDGNEEID